MNNYVYSDFEKIGFKFKYHDQFYVVATFPSNNGNFAATDQAGRTDYFNILDIINQTTHDYFIGNTKFCGKCGSVIINGENGCSMFENCDKCSNRRFNQTKIAPAHNYYADVNEELDILEAKCTSINYMYD